MRLDWSWVNGKLARAGGSVYVVRCDFQSASLNPQGFTAGCWSNKVGQGVEWVAVT